MMLTQCCRGEFEAGDRNRGEALSQIGCIELTVVGQDGAMAIAEGSRGEDYVVGLDFSALSQRSLGVHCDCPRFEDGYYCKHLWATLRKVDAEYDVLRRPILALDLYEMDVTTLEVGSEIKKRNSPGQRKLSPKERALELLRAKRAGAGTPATTPFANEIAAPTKKTAPQASPRSATWKNKLHRIATQSGKSISAPLREIPSAVFEDAVWQQQHWFVLSLAREANKRGLQIDVLRSTRKADGMWSKPTPCNVSPSELRTTVDQKERSAFSLLKPETDAHSSYAYYRPSASGTFNIDLDLIDDSLRRLQATDRFAWKLGDGRYFEDARPVKQVDVEGEAWQLMISISTNPDKETELVLAANLQRHNERIPISRVMIASAAGYGLIQCETDSSSEAIDARIVKTRGGDASAILAWQQTGQVIVPRRSINTLLAELAQSHASFHLDINAAIEVKQTSAVPSGRCLLKQRKSDSSTFDASLLVQYGDTDLAFDSSVVWWWDAKDKQLLHRDTAAERELLSSIPADAFRVDSLPMNGYASSYVAPATSLSVRRERFIEVVEKLRQAHWEVLAEGSPIRIATDFNVSVSSGTDWFDLHADVDFDGVTATLPQLLAALRSGNHTFVLDDGSCGMLPEAWLKKFAGLRASGEMTEDGIRFGRTQALLLDAMLAEQDDVHRDHSFTDFCAKLKNFEGISPAATPESFVGTMRPYQQWGLGWFEFLREFRFGGCLADDMGLGKTIQVLALLENRRTRELQKDEAKKPSLAVVPKSLIFNWIDEAKRFTPGLNVLNYTGLDRTQRFAESMLDKKSPLDLILTTYGTLRRDAAELRETEFDYVILDEAQAIKNPQSQAAKASRLLCGEHRLVMTGTPVENHLGDLWSLFDFLNPGMLGKAPRIAQLPDDEDRQRIAHVSQSLRPFILRRTKSQVLTELPEKVEQTLSCEMEPKQRKLYQQLKEHYRLHLSNKVKELGLKRSKIHVLEALLRLRQAACDPRLVNPDCGVTGAKLINLVQQLEEVIGEGHKALVFSQFTKLLALVRQELDARGWTYEYLDGKTNKRSEHVKRFQEDDDCKLFLISLKAGGNGLNLTAADYVFILDPWWNPAVEAQAIDRAHRMGQTKSVMAYRMICEGTVEEKIIAMQQSKRDLADAIISQDKSLISELTADDLQQLLS